MPAYCAACQCLFSFLHFIWCLCPVVKCVGVQMTLLGQRVHLFVINPQALPAALGRFPPQQSVGSLVPERLGQEAGRRLGRGPQQQPGLAPLRPSPFSGASHRAASPFPPTRQESRRHRFRSGLNVASQPSLASLLSTSLLRNKYLYLAPAFSHGLEAPAVKVHTESPIPSVPPQS